MEIPDGRVSAQTGEPLNVMLDQYIILKAEVLRKDMHFEFGGLLL